MEYQQSRVEKEKIRKKEQLFFELEKRGYQNVHDWEVITTLSKNNNFYTRFENKTLGQKARSIKWIVNNIPLAVPVSNSFQVKTECGICQCDFQESDGHKFLCNHWHCYDCINNYLKCEPMVLLDSEYHKVLCPTCKSNNEKTLIEIQELNKIVFDSKGVIQQKTLDDLNFLMVNLSLNGEEIYSCINKECMGKWTIEDQDDSDKNFIKFEVRCPICRTHQCSKCNISWSIHGNKCNDIPLDTESARLLAETCVKCPGQCGQYIEKYIEKYNDNDNDIHCNVLKCHLDKIYVCGLCGKKLDSSSFNMQDNQHSNASKHFWEGPLSCRQHLFTSRKKWLAIQKSK